MQISQDMLLPAVILPRTMPDAGAASALFAPLATSAVEQAMVAYLGEGAKLLGVRLLPPGTRDAVDLPMRLIVADALAMGATALVLAHNHPSGDARPSDADMALTRRLAQTLAAVEVRLVDHLVLGEGSTTSFRALGLL